MGVNPETNRIELLIDKQVGNLGTSVRALVEEAAVAGKRLFRPDGSEVPKHWTVLKQDELVDIKGYTFRIAYIGETSILLEPVKPTDTLVEKGEYY